MTSFDFEYVGRRSLYFDLKEFLCKPTCFPSFVCLTLLGAEIAGNILSPPLQGAVFHTLCSARMKISGQEVETHYIKPKQYIEKITV